MESTEYYRILQELVQFPEFRLALELLRGILIASVGVLAVLALFHTLYFLGQKSPMYRRKPPVDGWNRRFYNMLLFLIIVLLVLAWAIGRLVTAFA